MGYSSYGYDDRTNTKSTNASCKHYSSFPTRNGPVYWWSCEMSRRAPGVFGRATEPNQALLRNSSGRRRIREPVRAASQALPLAAASTSARVRGSVGETLGAPGHETAPGLSACDRRCERLYGLAPSVPGRGPAARCSVGGWRPRPRPPAGPPELPGGRLARPAGAARWRGYGL